MTSNAASLPRRRCSTSRASSRAARRRRGSGSARARGAEVAPTCGYIGSNADGGAELGGSRRRIDYRRTGASPPDKLLGRMANRKEQKEKLRQERLARETAADQAAQRKKLVGYGAAAVLVLAA